MTRDNEGASAASFAAACRQVSLQPPTHLLLEALVIRAEQLRLALHAAEGRGTGLRVQGLVELPVHGGRGV